MTLEALTASNRILNSYSRQTLTKVHLKKIIEKTMAKEMFAKVWGKMYKRVMMNKVPRKDSSIRLGLE